MSDDVEVVFRTAAQIEAARLEAKRQAGWQSMETAPKDRAILTRRYNDVTYEYAVVHWNDWDPIYPWVSLDNAYAEGRLDQWHEIPS